MCCCRGKLAHVRRRGEPTTHLEVGDEHEPVIHDEIRDEVELDNSGESDVATEKGEEAEHGQESEVGDVDKGAMTRFEERRVGIEV